MRDEAAVRQYVEDMARLLAEWGLPRMAGRVIWTLMCAEERSLTAGELAERLGVSPAAISGAVRYCIQINMVAREHEPGSRRDRYRLVDDSWYEVTIAKMSLLDTIRAGADKVLESAGGPKSAAGRRIADMRDFYTYVQAAMPELMGRWQEQKRSRG